MPIGAFGAKLLHDFGYLPEKNIWLARSGGKYNERNR